VLELWRLLDDDRGLLEAEDVGARVVGAQQVDSVVRAVPVVLVVAFQRHAELDVLERIFFGRRRRVGRRLLPRVGSVLRERRARRGGERREQEEADAGAVLPQMGRRTRLGLAIQPVAETGGDGYRDAGGQN